ncbi:sigma-70 family RNA polymerase sigma factor [Actinophytocola sp.]|uniref:RNA polymerase sigma factor n=1 Tax=Actinophytocola sp. TaxID=1872138 RepID=UPI002D802AB7|nr:sigma-70 family RNA polymerase sigma factor [Actinophytocola sp.]HET9139705.1 sigma-70 family RNA polymerase sigma factor [Actinophytocola sp.]HEU5110499.1 sigma-70 family RNA polymerase sigma factor [Micromonosporaceae bacterium]
MSRARDGDLDAYGVLVARYRTLAHRTAYLLGAGASAEDVVQEAFVKGFRALRGFRPDGAFRPWLLRIVANETSNLHRSARRRAALELRVAGFAGEAGHPDPEQEAISGASRTALLNAVRALPEKDAHVITCRFFLDLSEAETAQVLGWPRGTVKSRLSRALAKLRPAMSGGLGEEAAHG